MWKGTLFVIQFKNRLYWSPDAVLASESSRKYNAVRTGGRYIGIVMSQIGKKLILITDQILGETVGVGRPALHADLFGGIEKIFLTSPASPPWGSLVFASQLTLPTKWPRYWPLGDQSEASCSFCRIIQQPSATLAHFPRTWLWICDLRAKASHQFQIPTRSQ